MSIETPQSRRAAVVIVGGGMAGLELAYWLARGGQAGVVVIEAGPAGDRRHARAGGAAIERWRPWVSHSPPNYDTTSGLVRRLGGRSLHWHGVILPIEPSVLHDGRWPRRVVGDLTDSWNGGKSLYSLVQSDLSDWVGARSTVYDFPLVVRGQVLEPTPRARRWIHPGETWEAYSALTRWHDLSADVMPTFMVDTEVIGVTHHAGSATGVVVRRGSATDLVNAPVVVLAAATIPNTRLVGRLHSGLRGRRRTYDGLSDHVDQGYMALVDTEHLPPALAEAARSGSSHHVRLPGRNLFLRLQACDETGDRTVVEVYGTTEQPPDHANTVTTDNGVPNDSVTVVNASLTRDDRGRIATTGNILHEFWADLRSSCGNRLGAPPAVENWTELADSATQMRRLTEASPSSVLPWCSVLGSVDHEAGTVGFGDHLDDDGAVRGWQGVYVLGAATFPRSGAANPSLTVLALARRLAGLLVTIRPDRRSG